MIAPPPPTPRILIMLNGWTQVFSGGDYHILKVTERWKSSLSLTFLMPRPAVDGMGGSVAGQVIFSSGERAEGIPSIPVVIWRYLIRCAVSIIKASQLHPDVVIAASHFLPDIVPAVWSRLNNPNARLVVFFHGSISPGRTESRSSLRWMNDSAAFWLIKRYCDLTFVVSPIARERLIKVGIQPRKVVLTSNGIDGLRPESTEVKFQACYVGRLVKSKGVLDLPEIWTRVCRDIPHAKLAVVGDGPEKHTLAQMLKKSGLQGSARLFGHLGDERFKIMGESMLFLLPSYAEAWPVALVEAMSCGLPVIVYDLEELRLTWGASIQYVKPGDTASFAATVTRLLTDESARGRLSLSSREASKGHLWDDVAAGEMKAIQALVHQED